MHRAPRLVATPTGAFFSLFSFSFSGHTASSNDNLNVLAYHRRQAYIKPKKR